MTDDQYSKLLQYMEEFFNDIDARFEAIDKRFDELINTINS